MKQLYEKRLQEKIFVIRSRLFADVHKIGLLKNFDKFIGKNLYQRLYLMNLQASTMTRKIS